MVAQPREDSARAAGAAGVGVLLLLRCLLDTWDETYYLLPFILALLAWEIGLDTRRLPVFALSSTVLAWISFIWLPNHVSADFQAAFFLAWTLPLAGVLGLSLWVPQLRSKLSWRTARETIMGSLSGYTDAVVAAAMLGVLYYFRCAWLSGATSSTKRAPQWNI